jgi:predicted HicB family RNase H-like nuclease
METRHISLTLEKAKEWYNSGSADLKEVALQAYSEQELKTEDWKRIKTFEDACTSLGISPNSFFSIGEFNLSIENHLTALYKLDIIRQALNQDYKPSLVRGEVYYPWIRFYNDYNSARNTAKRNNWELCGEIEIEGTTYYLVGGNYYCSCGRGISAFGCTYGYVDATMGLLCCKSKEVAQHMSKYFAKEIFDAIYTQHNNYK